MVVFVFSFICYSSPIGEGQRAFQLDKDFGAGNVKDLKDLKRTYKKLIAGQNVNRAFAFFCILPVNRTHFSNKISLSKPIKSVLMLACH